MTIAIGATSPGGANSLRTASASPTAGANSASNAVSVLANTAEPLSPRWRNDPQAGLILEYLSKTGTVTSQVPSQTVVAYLRSGLTEQGSKRDNSAILTA